MAKSLLDKLLEVKTLHLIMFDIDGTLINSYKFDEECYLKAAQKVLGISISTNWNEYTNSTDTGILNEAINRYNVQGDKNTILQNFKQVFKKRIIDCIGDSPGRVQEINGASYFIRHLVNNKNVKVAIATGGFEETAKLKLKAAGININGCSFASSSDHDKRTEIMKIAEKRVTSHVSFKSKTYFGDASWDREASEILGYRFILVGNRFAHDECIQDFKDIESIRSMLKI